MASQYKRRMALLKIYSIPAYKYRQASKEKTVKVMLIKVIVQLPGAMYMLDYCKFCNHMYMYILIIVYDHVRI